MANPSGHVIFDEEATSIVEERYAVLEAELQAMRARNEELACGLQDQRQLRADKSAQGQIREFANLIAELLVGRRGPEVQMDGMRIGVKVEKPENYDGSKGRDLDTWLFQV